jgi:hypothetical protein
VRQPDIEANGRRLSFRGSTVCGFHNAGTAAGRDHIVADPVARPERAPSLGRDPPKAPRLFIPPRRLVAGARHRARWQRRRRLGFIGTPSRQHTRAPEHDDGRAYDPGAQSSLCLFVFKLPRTPRMESPSRKTGSRAANRCFGSFVTTPGGFMGKREPQIILKTDERSIHLELGRERKFTRRIKRWAESRRRQARGRSQERPPAADPASGGAATGRAAASLLLGRIVAPSQRPATPLRCAVTCCGRGRQRCW